MGQHIVKLKEYYLVWSSIVDAPITDGMTLKQLKRWMRSEYGVQGMRGLDEKIKRADEMGTSSRGDSSAVSRIWLNRAGPKESTLTIEGIYRHYCLKEDIQPEWIVPGRVIGGDDDDDGPTYAAVTAGWE